MPNIEDDNQALSIENLTKIYKNGFQALHGVNLTISNGDFFALLGPNGAGKSTIIGILSSLVNKTTGVIKIFGIDQDANPNLTKSFVGVVPQEFNFGIFETLERILINQAGYYGIPKSIAIARAHHYLQLLGLYEKKDSQSGKLSGGMKRRLMIARALIHEPKLLILDEPTAGVDIELRRSMWDFLIELNRLGTTIILTTHYLEEAETLCKNIAIIDKGRIVENTSKKNLIDRLDKEVFILDLKEPVESIPTCPGLLFEKIDNLTWEVTIPKSTPINNLFNHLEVCRITVLSLKNKTNRLEELFLNLVEKSLN